MGTLRANVGGSWVDIGTDGAPGADAVLGADSVTNAILADMAPNSIKGNNTGSPANPTDLTVASIKAMLALNNVDNTADTAKPVSTAQQTALNLKADAATTITGTGALTGGGTLAANRTINVLTAGITKAMQENVAPNSIVGNNTGSGAAPADLSVAATKSLLALNNVDNTSDASKPVSTLTQTALNAKANSSVSVTGTGALTGGGTLTGNQTISVATAGITKAMQENMAANSIRANNTGSPAVPTDLSIAATRTMLSIFNIVIGTTALTTGAAPTITIGPTQPSVGMVTNDIWIDTT